MRKAVAFALVVIFSAAVASPITVMDMDWMGPIGIISEDEYQLVNDESPVDIVIDVVEPYGMITVGSRVVLRCVVTGVDEPYAISWQYSDDPEGYIFYDLDCHEERYEFIADKDNVDYFYRVQIMITDSEEGRGMVGKR